MKQFAVIVAFLILLNPLGPVIDYVINYNYIVKEVCVNRNKPQSCCKGKCYLKKELAKSVAGENNNSKKSDLKKLELPVVFLVNNFYRVTRETKITSVSNNTSSYHVSGYRFLYSVQQLRPPIGVC